MGLENRHFKRVNMRFTVEYRGKNVWQTVENLNVSKGGLFIVTDKVEPMGTAIEVIFDFGNENRRRVTAEAEVVWVRQEPGLDQEGNMQPRGMGIEFRKVIPQDAEKFLHDLIDNWEEQ